MLQLSFGTFHGPKVKTLWHWSMLLCDARPATAIGHKVADRLATWRFSSICQIPALSCRKSHSKAFDCLTGYISGLQEMQKMAKENTPGLEHVHLMVQESVLAKIVGIVLNAEQWSQTEADVRVQNCHNQSRRMQPWSSFIWWLAILQRTCGEQNVLDTFLHTSIYGPIRAYAIGVAFFGHWCKQVQRCK